MYAILWKVCFMFAACYGHTHKDKQKKVDVAVDAGGSILQEYTVLLSLDDFKSVYCAGTLISEYWVLTIATCLKRGALSIITVHKETKLPGGNFTYTGKRFSHIKRAFIHQQFGIPMNTYNDLALLRLERALEIGENQTRVVLPTEVEDVEQKFKNQPLHMTRYCSMHNSIEFKDAWPQDRSLCRYPYNKKSFDKVFCALFQEERKTKFKDANDMGGPVVDRNNTLYGLVPYALFCKRMADRFCICGFAKIDMFVDFINNTIREYESGIAVVSATPAQLVLLLCTFLHLARYFDRSLFELK